MTRERNIFLLKPASEGIQRRDSRCVPLNAYEADTKGTTILTLGTLKAIAQLVQQINRRLGRDSTESISSKHLEEPRRSTVGQGPGGDAAGENRSTNSNEEAL